jgi:hypothetical protein
MKKFVLIITLVSLMGMLTGCAALFSGGKATMTATSDPEGAEVFVNGVSYGMTPVQFKLKTNQSYKFVFKKEGYQPVERFIENKIGVTWLVLDVLAGGIPVVIDAATGAWYVLEQQNVDAQLKKLYPAP